MNSKSITRLPKTCLALAILAAGAAYVAQASAADVQKAPGYLAPAVQNPYSPAYKHAYRHGVVPTRQVLNAMKQWAGEHPATTNSKTLAFGGGNGGVGVMSGQNKAYIVFYGTQWGTASTDANGNLKFTNDTAGAAGAAQQMFKGIGTNGELWSAELTQWCNDVASGATSCSASDTTHIPYQQNILAGVWYDNTQASPSAATAAQLANEAIAAAAHFGNTTVASNRSAYYMILSPKGTNPDNYQDNYCAWHDYTADAGVNSPYGEMAFSNQPYNIDSGQGCGVNFVNNGSAGTLDGFTMTLGHEWHEMMSDQFPEGGWTNHNSGTYAGEENSDECAWLNAGTPGGAANITFSTGTFAEQASYSNDTASCAISHAIIIGGGTTPTANFSYTTNGLVVTFTDSSSDVGGHITSHSWAFGDGTNLATKSPTHTYAAAGTYSVVETVTDSGGNTASKTALVVVSAGGPTTQLLGNTGFESGTAAPWTISAGVLDNGTGEPAHTGSWKAKMNGHGTTQTDTVSQLVTIPAGTKATLSYYMHIDTAETGTTANDHLYVRLYNGTKPLKTLQTYSNLNARAGYTVHSNDVSAYVGQTVTVKFTGVENASNQTSFVLDDVTLTVQ